MTSSSRRVALLTGVSAAAMGFAFPANAQVSPGTSHVVTGTSVEDTLVISCKHVIEGVGHKI